MLSFSLNAHATTAVADLVTKGDLIPLLAQVALKARSTPGIYVSPDAAHLLTNYHHD